MWYMYEKSRGFDMPEIDIKITKTVQCPQFIQIPILYSLCRQCPSYRYEIIGGKMMCGWTQPKIKPKDKGPSLP